jgi:hypothetical protein
VAKRTVRKKTAVKKKPASKKKAVSRKIDLEKNGSVICFNRDCKLRKKKSCKGFEACPGFKGR